MCITLFFRLRNSALFSTYRKLYLTYFFLNYIIDSFSPPISVFTPSKVIVFDLLFKCFLFIFVFFLLCLYFYFISFTFQFYHIFIVTSARVVLFCVAPNVGFTPEISPSPPHISSLCFANSYIIFLCYLPHLFSEFLYLCFEIFVMPFLLLLRLFKFNDIIFVHNFYLLYEIIFFQ